MEGEDSMKQSKLGTAVQIAGFVGIFLLLLVPVSYMVRTNGDVKDRFSGFYAEKKDSLDIVMITVLEKVLKFSNILFPGKHSHFCHIPFYFH